MAAAAGTPAAKLLDFSQPLDVPLLDATVTAFYGAASTEEVSLATGFYYISAYTASPVVASDDGASTPCSNMSVGFARRPQCNELTWPAASISWDPLTKSANMHCNSRRACWQPKFDRNSSRTLHLGHLVP